MQYRRLGRCGLRLSELSLGGGNWGYQAMDEKTVAETVALALDAGINYFDNAQSYTNGLAEEIMGRLFRKLDLRRVSYVVSTKYYWGISDGPNERNTLNRKYLIDGINGSLRRLQMEYVDIVYCHRNDPNTPIEETVWALHNIIESGKALYWGTSEWRADEIRAAWEIAVFSPLAGGTLTGKYRAGLPAGSRADDPNLARFHDSLLGKQRNQIVDGLDKIARTFDCSLTELSLAWVLSNPNVTTAILGVSRPSQLTDNLRALDVVPKLTAEVKRQMLDIVGDYSAPWSTVTDPL